MSFIIGRGRYARATYPTPARGGGAGGATPARNWNEHTTNGIASGTPTIVVSTTVTPATSGIFRVTVTGSAVGGGDGGQDQFTPSLSNGGSATPAIATSSSQFTSHDNSQDATIAWVVDLDKAGGTGTPYPLGTPVQFNAVLEFSGNNAPAVSTLQIEVQEVPAAT